MRVLVAGASGYLGAHIAEYLADQGFNVTAQVRKKPCESGAWQEKMSSLLVGDIRSIDFLNEIAACRADAIIYAISLNQKASEFSIESAIETNVVPLWKLMDVTSDGGVKRFIYLSTQQVYGRGISGPINEDSLVAPVNNYGLTHLMCENISRLYASRTEQLYLNLRLSNGFGSPRLASHECWRLVVNDFCQMASNSGEICLLSDGTPQRDFIHVVDICKAVGYFLKVRSQKITHNVYNVGSGETVTIFELAHIVANCFRKKLNREIPVYLSGEKKLSSVKSVSASSRMSYDVRRAASVGFRPKKSLEDGIFEVIDYLQRVNHEKVGVL